MDRKLRVVARAAKKKAPDKIKIYIGLVAEAKTAEVANSIFSKKVALLNNILSQSGFDKQDLKTENFIIDVNREWQNGMQVDNGYYAKADYTLLMDIDYIRLEKIISSITQALGIKVTYDVLLSDITELENQVIELAVQDAKDKATLIAEYSGIRLGDIVYVDYQSAPSYAALRASNDGMQPSEDIEISKTIEMVWEII